MAASRPSLVSLLALALLLLPACAEQEDVEDVTAAAATLSVEQEPFGTLPEGDSATVFTLTNAHGMQLRVTDYGGTITSLLVPGADGELADVVLGFDTLEGYLSEAYQASNPYFGAIIGRYGNRIDQGTFTIDGEEYQVTQNTPPHHLHGGAQGFDKVLWNAEPFEREDAVGIVFTRTSPAGEQGYPGTLEAEVTYTLNNQNELIFDYYATTDEATPVNLTQHSYFNLAGEHEGDVLGHRLMINAEAFTPVDEDLIPTGEVRLVADTPFDFREVTSIGARIGAEDEQLRRGGGYDHNFVLNREGVPEDALALAARVYEPVSGRLMEIHTTEPAIQFYSGNFLDGSLTDDDGEPFAYRSGFALETQHYPDAPNQPGFPSTILRPGEEYRSRTVLAFSAQESLDAVP